MIKVVKMLKFWSRKKRKKKTHHQPYYPPPPPTRPAPLPLGHQHHCCSCSSSTYSTQPLAPPLPPWLDAEYTHDPESLLAPQVQPPPQFGYQPGPRQHEPSMKTNAGSGTTSTSSSLYLNPTSSSYQQYIVPDTVYGVPVAQTQTQTPRATTRERSAASGVFGCVVDFGIRFFRCFCPVFKFVK